MSSPVQSGREERGHVDVNNMMFVISKEPGSHWHMTPRHTNRSSTAELLLVASGNIYLFFLKKKVILISK